MNEQKNIDHVSESNNNPQDVNENSLQEQTIEQSQSENMEVHHHPDLHYKRKHFKEYFLEFLMTFLAVTMGFFAESYREHVIDNRKEKEFILSLKEDLVSDTIQLKYMILAGKLQYEKLDSLYTLLRLAREQKPFNMNRLYYLNFKYSFGLLVLDPISAPYRK